MPFIPDEIQNSTPRAPSTGGFTPDPGQVIKQQKEQSILGAGLSAGGKAAANFVPDFLKTVKDTIVGLVNPNLEKNTIVNTGRAAIGVGESIARGITKTTDKQKAPDKNEQIFRSVVDSFVNKYGSLENAANTAQEHPFQFGSDLATILAGGESLLSKTGLVEGGTLAKTISPIAKTTTKPLSVAGKTAINLSAKTLGVTTGAGEMAIKTAFQGGPEFTAALRGRITPTTVLEETKNAVGQLKEMRRSEYVSKLAEISKNTKSIDISPILETFSKKLQDFGVTAGKGGKLDFSRSSLRLSREGQADVNAIHDSLVEWGSKPGDRTPIALDALKKSLGDLYSPSGQARAIVTDVKNSVSNVLNKEVPGYETMTKGYQDYSNLLTDIKQNLAVGGKAGNEAALKRLSGALKQNNELRLEVLKKLEGQTGVNLRDRIAGASLSDTIPRGLIGKGIDLYVAKSLFTGLLSPAAIATMVSTSPRLVGELVRALGIGYRGVGKVTDAINTIPESLPGAVNNLEQKIKETPYKQGGFAKISTGKKVISSKSSGSEITQILSRSGRVTFSNTVFHLPGVGFSRIPEKLANFLKDEVRNIPDSNNGQIPHLSQLERVVGKEKELQLSDFLDKSERAKKAVVSFLKKQQSSNVEYLRKNGKYNGSKSLK